MKVYAKSSVFEMEVVSITRFVKSGSEQIALSIDGADYCTGLFPDERRKGWKWFRYVGYYLYLSPDWKIY